MGDLVAAEDELQRATGALHAGGLDQTAIHKHLQRNSVSGRRSWRTTCSNGAPSPTFCSVAELPPNPLPPT
ncbi:DUF1259 domain-containing protein [Kitasatospora sp. NPDC018058]|uniref:DUF1259 domain-containing protein n=1 Tax=Kitasatospora sp. NPDC018058 TaxID=3364025 RepID=UPI0037C14140